VLIGTHGVGSLESFALATGRAEWRVRAPNWIHQDAVSDGRIVVVGFGDNRGSAYGSAASGVAAFELATGKSTWTKFEKTAVMTSPVIVGGDLVYGTGAGVIRRRRLSDGLLRESERFRGGVSMAPPLARHDTIVWPLDDDRVCVNTTSSLRPLWCTKVPGYTHFGHAAASLAGDTVIVSGRIPNDVPLAGTVLNRFLGRLNGGARGQGVVALDLRTGAVRWKSQRFPFVREADGHISGTAAVADSLVVITLPISDPSLPCAAVRWASPGRSRAWILADRR
jgi:outer membrane protein assembly factor BamB